MYLAYTISGLEEVAEKELKGKKIFKNRISFSKKKRNYFSVDKIIEVIKIFDLNSLDDIGKNIKKIKFKIKNPFSVVCTRTGDHDFNSVQAASCTASLLIKQGFIVTPGMV